MDRHTEQQMIEQMAEQNGHAESGKKNSFLRKCVSTIAIFGMNYYYY